MFLYICTFFRCVHRGGVKRVGCRRVAYSAYSVFACHAIARDRYVLCACGCVYMCVCVCVCVCMCVYTCMCVHICSVERDQYAWGECMCVCVSVILRITATGRIGRY